MTPPAPTVSLQKAGVSGEGQTAVVATSLPTPISVVAMIDGEPVAGVVVTFIASPGSGSAGQAVDTTDIAGVASSGWTLGAKVGAATLSASLAGAIGSPQIFHATAVHDSAATFDAAGGDDQVQDAGLSFSQALRVLLQDQFGNPVSLAHVEWRVVSGSGFITSGGDATDGTGHAAVSVTAGDTAGPLTIRATTPALPSDTVLFALTVVPPSTTISIGNNFFNPSSLTVLSGTWVKWKFNAGTHTVTQLDGPEALPSSAALSAGATFGPVLFTTVGVYHYECSLHAGMTGSVTVE